MSKIKQLKQIDGNNLNLVDVLELFSPDKKSKYTETLLRFMKNTQNIDEHVREIKAHLSNEFDFISNEDLNKFSEFQIMLIYKFIDSFFNCADLKSFRRFCEYNERGLITQNDLTKYKSFEEMTAQLTLADLKVEAKGLENEIVKVFEDDEWLLVRPLTYFASKKYGANTKWCTTSEGNPEYFIKYSSKGVLIYCINKNTGYKVASFYSLDKRDPEFSFWNQKDSRVDSLDTELTTELRELIGNVSKDKKAKTNRFLLSDEQRIKEDKLNNINNVKQLVSQYETEEPEPMQEMEVETQEEVRQPLIEAMMNRNEERRARERRLMGEVEPQQTEEFVNVGTVAQDIVERMRLVSNNDIGVLPSSSSLDMSQD